MNLNTYCTILDILLQWSGLQMCTDSESPGQVTVREVTLSFQSESRVVTVTIFVPGRDTQVALEPCLQSLRVVSATKGSEHDRHCRAASGSALVRLH
jgi:hypothetical protein